MSSAANNSLTLLTGLSIEANSVKTDQNAPIGQKDHQFEIGTFFEN